MPNIDQSKSYARLALGMREAALPNTGRERQFQPILWKNRLVARAIQAPFTNQSGEMSGVIPKRGNT